MTPGTEFLINLSQFIDILAIVLSIVALVVTVIGFFASLKFYREGTNLQKLVNDTLVKIEERANSIHLQVGGMFDKTLTAAIANKEQISTDFDAVNEILKKTEQEIISNASHVLGEAKAENLKIRDMVKSQMDEVRELIDTARRTSEDAVDAQDIPYTVRVMNGIRHLLLLGGKSWILEKSIRKSIEAPSPIISKALINMVKNSEIEKKVEGDEVYYRKRPKMSRSWNQTMGLK